MNDNTRTEKLYWKICKKDGSWFLYYGAGGYSMMTSPAFSSNEEVLGYLDDAIHKAREQWGDDVNVEPVEIT